MNILIDIGNTRAKYVIENDQRLSAITNTACINILQELETLTEINSIIIVAVANQSVVDEIAVWAKSQSIKFQQLNTQANTFGIINGYQDYQQMGADRWIAVLGAQALYPNHNLLIVDSGTATTFDVLAASGNHLGGWIVPGVELMINSLFDNTDKVKGVINKVESIEFGLNTNDNVNYGCWAASNALVDYAVLQAKQSGVVIDRVIFTGGNGCELKKHCNYKSKLEEQLIFIGMQRFIK
ncbi:type III pantothenate kinase [Thalassomonas sp. M1454]|uniref:type III pantothenate kinase n=1 Tax=Thalassomonas sp. M1454 TaxID=2594477 RepID=UPI00117F3448|nr:type III pantothenate kinase [Thalassomonas sp. M1454]TRX55232.1 type III pantothenate kinase [Thalassomonas sp. M1454]